MEVFYALVVVAVAEVFFFYKLGQRQTRQKERALDVKGKEVLELLTSSEAPLDAIDVATKVNIDVPDALNILHRLRDSGLLLDAPPLPLRERYAVTPEFDDREPPYRKVRLAFAMLRQVAKRSLGRRLDPARRNNNHVTH